MNKEEAIKIVRSHYPANKQMLNEALEFLIPELKEDENEEIRKEIIAVFKGQIAFTSEEDAKKYIDWLEKQVPVYLSHDDEIMIRQLTEYFTTGKGLQNTNDTVVEWLEDVKRKLEKQGEQKPADKVEPKFKVGEWIITPENKVLQITSIEGTTYRFNHESHYWETYYCDKQCRLWTIQDAKDGDVLHCWIDGDEFILIYKGVKDGYITTYGHLYQKLKLFAEEPTTMFCRTIQGHFTPATKEQHDTLMKVMAGAGYTFDFDKKELKELKKIEQKWWRTDYDRQL